MRWIKDPNATLNYQWDWSAWLDTGDSIASVTFLVPAGLTVVSEAYDSTTATVWLRGGTEPHTYPVTCRVSTSLGLIDDRTAEIQVRRR